MEIKTFRDLMETLSSLPSSELDKEIAKNFQHSEGSNQIHSVSIKLTDEEHWEDSEGYVATESTVNSLSPAERADYRKLKFPRGTILFSYD